ncbi:MAG: divalent-cation tolerance protein CutA [Sphingomonas sp.]|jgi:periplasmic divalent cation tolerance protein|nr:divalent-cation tolerance protein CutA [Sphingomonas sp.]
MTVVSVYSTFADAAEAERIGRQVVEEQLAACVNVLGPCRSIYRWRGAIESADEVAAIFKTTSAGADTLIARIAALHSYDVPAIAVWPIERLLEPYASWVEDNVAPRQ